MQGHVRAYGRNGGSGRYDFNPVTVGILNEINSHGFIFKTDASHFFMTGMGCLHIIYGKGQMEFIIA